MKQTEAVHKVGNTDGEEMVNKYSIVTDCVYSCCLHKCKEES